MSWDAWLDDGKGAFPFGRPIRWLVALLDGKVVPFTIYELVRRRAKGRRDRRERRRHATATASCRAARRGGPLQVALASPTSTKQLREALRAPRPRGARRAHPRGSSRRAAAARRVADDHGLLAEWRDLVEYPTVVVGRDPGRVPDAAARGAARPCSSTTRSTCPLVSGGTVDALRGRDQHRRRDAARDRPRHGARGGGAAARRRVLLRRGPEAAAGRARRRTWPA